MFTKCTACGARILAGGETFLERRFCNAACVSRFQAALTEQAVPKDVLEEQVQRLFNGPCLECGREGGNDLHSARRVSAFLVFFRIDSQQKVLCASCGRKHRLLAALHCLVLGWWGPKAAICNLFILPTNLISAALVRTPTEPSPAFRAWVKARIGETLAPQLLAARAGSGGADPAERDA